MRRVYLDHNATTPIRPEVREHLLDALDRFPGNPSSIHTSGREARQELDLARERVAGALGVLEDEVVFTSGGTEANNMALLGLLRPRGSGAGLATTAIEHSSVLECARALDQEGHPVLLHGVDRSGFPDVDAIVAAGEERSCALVSVMSANNEVGSVPDIATIGARLRELPTDQRPFVHTDAVQALGKLPVVLEGVDLATFSAHKVGGPRGVGVLFKRARVTLDPLHHGGEQEGGLRPGTENLAAISAAALAIDLAVTEQSALAERSLATCRSFWLQLHSVLPQARLVGPDLDSPHRLPNTLNVSLPNVDGRVLVTRLDLAGLEVSAGSACASGSIEPSHVLLAMGLPPERARAGLRVSFGRNTTDEDVHIAVDTMRKTFAPPAESRTQVVD